MRSADSCTRSERVVLSRFDPKSSALLNRARLKSSHYYITRFYKLRTLTMLILMTLLQKLDHHCLPL